MAGLRVTARYLPASHGMDIGGDFYDLIRLGHRRGSRRHRRRPRPQCQRRQPHGPGPHRHPRLRRRRGAPGEVLARTNRLLGDLDPDLLTSCPYAHLDITDHRAHLATAGHCQPLLRHADQHTTVLALPAGPLLGADPEAHCPGTEIALPSGAVLALCTDGLIETAGTDPDTNLGELAALLSHPVDSLGTLANSLLHHARPSGDRTDDTALLLTTTASPGTSVTVGRHPRLPVY
ncbi:PP2C family protein-serine/threonine phosphatase [Streptomyces sp. ME19-01-6]|nr:PP2C family protein-serine/threonine phosphatase [Streptomyces sp. ME19-01-6]MDX3227619.1 PP2C family protein-serine/threonine phosphatase [Streptomyces sp. ME19-01-6]